MTAFLSKGPVLFNTRSQSLPQCPQHSRCLIFGHGKYPQQPPAFKPCLIFLLSLQTLFARVFPAEPNPQVNRRVGHLLGLGAPEPQWRILVTRGRSLLRFLPRLGSFSPLRGHKGLQRVLMARSGLFVPLGKESWSSSPETRWKRGSVLLGCSERGSLSGLTCPHPLKF